MTVAAHLSPDELAHRYRKAVDPVERSHFHIIWRLSQGKRVSEVALVTDHCPNWNRILARRYNQHGPQVLADQRKQNTGALPLLSNGQKNQLRQLLEHAPPDGGLWTGPKVAHWMIGADRAKDPRGAPGGITSSILDSPSISPVLVIDICKDETARSI